MSNTETLTRCPKCGTHNAQLRDRCKACGALLHGTEEATFETTDAPRAKALAPRGKTAANAGSEDGLTADSLKPGDVVKDTYKLLEFIGEGGAGAVFVGEHTSLGNLVAIKTLFGKFVRDADMRRRFVEEGIIQANLAHKNIIRVTDIVDEDQFCAIIMEYIEGRSLDRLIRKAGREPDVEAMTRLFLEMLDGVGYAHDQGIVHRDLKPANVLLARAGESWTPKISDFGIAKIVSDMKRTETGTTMGTVHYAAPEQLTNAKAVDARADIYALGCTFYEMLTGDVPFDGDSIYQIMRAHIEAPRPDASADNPDVPRALALVVKRSMAVDPEKRFSNCREFAAEVLSAMDRKTASALHGLGSDAMSGSRPALKGGLKPPTRLATPGSSSGPEATRGPARPPTRSRTSAPGVTSSTTRDRRVAAATTVRNAPQQRGGGTAGMVVKIAIGVLALGIVGLIFTVTNRGGDDPPPTNPIVTADTPVPTPATDVAEGSGNEVASATDTGDDDSGEPVAELTPAEQVTQCRDLAQTHRGFDLLGDVPINTAIAELEDAHANCLATMLDAGNGTRFDILRAHLTADEMRFTMHSLRALREATVGGDPCTDVIMASTETQRSLRRLHDAEVAEALLDWEIQSLSEQREAAWTLLSGLADRYPRCELPDIPEELVPEHARVPEPVNPQIGETRVVGEGSGEGSGEATAENDVPGDDPS